MSSQTPAGFVADARLAEAGFTGGVTTRAMGDMADPAQRARALEMVGLGHLPAYDLKQEHGCVVHDLVSAPSQPRLGDGWCVHSPGRVALAYVADCMPIFVWDADGAAAAVLHSGWKGTKANIAAVGVAALFRRGAAAASLRAVIGPHIGRCCYAVGDDFEKYFRAGSLERRGGKLYLDLGAEARAQLISAGVPASAISSDAACTACSGLFYSFRREKSGTRMMAFLAMRHD